jgi:tRNA threonylcarbamoyladenosine biosynthesis protein TsaE
MHFYLYHEAETVALAQRLAKNVLAPCVLTFEGEIGAGKTTFIRAFLRTLGVTGNIKSPTFSLVESYTAPPSSSTIHPLLIHHFDLYRVIEETELDYIGFRDYFSPETICCIEWPENAGSQITNVDLVLKINTNNTTRSLTIQAKSDLGVHLINTMMA